MARTDAGRNAIAGLIIGTGTAFGTAAGHLGVGNSSTAFNVSQTDLVGASKTRKAVDSANLATNVITYQATFGSGDANHAWDEVGVFNAAAAGTMLARVVAALGTKSGGVWVLTHTVTVT